MPIAATFQGTELNRGGTPTRREQFGPIVPLATEASVTDVAAILADQIIRIDDAEADIGLLDGRVTATETDIADLGTASALDSDTDTTLSANSDTRLATQKAVKTYVDTAVVGLLDLKGGLSCAANPNYPSALKGDAYYVSAAGKIGGASGKSVDIGDVFVASADNAGGTEASVGTSWFVLEHNLTGALLASNNLSDLTNATTARTNLGLAIGTDVQAFNANLSAYAGGDTPSAFTLGIVDSANAAAWRSAIGAGTSSATGTVTSVDLSGGTTGLSASGGPIATAGTFTLSGTLVAANGGTGQSSYAVGDLLYASTTSALSKLADVAIGNALLSGGVGVAPSWGKIGLTTHVTGTLPVANGGTGVTTSTGSGANVQATQPQFTNTIGVGVAASTSGAGISFPATQSASTDSNTLDDYEEGTWTPTVVSEGGAITTYSASGYYTKVGRHVEATVLITMTNYGTATGALIASLPFTAATGPSWVGAGRETVLVGNMLQGIITSGSATMAIRSYNNATPGTSGCSLVVSVSYFV